MTAFVTKYVQDLFHVFVKKYTMIIISFKNMQVLLFITQHLGSVKVCCRVLLESYKTSLANETKQCY